MQNYGNRYGDGRDERSGGGMPPKSVSLGAAVVVLFGGVMIASKIGSSKSARSENRLDTDVRALVSSAMDSATSFRQDAELFVALLDIDHAITNLKCAVMISSAKDVERLCNINPTEYIAEWERSKMDVMRKIHDVCPNLQPDGVFSINSSHMPAARR